MEPTDTPDTTTTPPATAGPSPPATEPAGAGDDLLSRYAALGSPEQLATLAQEVESLRAGVDDAKVEKIAGQRAEQQLAQLRKPLDSQIKSLQTTLGQKDKALQTTTRQLHDVVARNLWQSQVAASEDFKSLDPLAVRDLYGKAQERGLVKLEVPESGDIQQARLIVWDPAAGAPMGDGSFSAADLMARFRDTGPDPSETSDRPFAGLHYFFTSGQSGPGLQPATPRTPTTTGQRLETANSLGAIAKALGGGSGA